MALAIALASAGAASAAKAVKVKWNRIDGPTGAGNEIGLVRGSDGVLHAVWIKGTTPSTISDTRISARGRPAGTSTVASGWDGNGGIAGLMMPDQTLRLFVTGGHVPNLPTAQTGVNSFTAPASGSPWTLDAGRVWGGTIAYDSGTLGATLMNDGQPVTAWSGTGVGTVHVGLDPNTPNSAFGSDLGSSLLATDHGSGAVVLSGSTVAGSGGAFVQQVLPSAGGSQILPGTANAQASGLAGRIGTGGVYVAWTNGKTIKLTRVGGGTRTLARGLFSFAKVFAAPGGRLWVAWGDTNDGLYITRSNAAVTRFEKVQHLKLASGDVAGLGNENGEGSTGPLDFFALFQIGASDRGYWQTHVFPKLSIRRSVGKSKRGKRKVTITVTDAGDPVSGASVKVGSKKLKTGANGRVTLSLRSGSYKEKATAPGYAGGSGRVKVKA
ncbi:MAG TPA: hypothetical protein VGF74_00015 [Thermoleophilaceae bacterium]